MKKLKDVNLSFEIDIKGDRNVSRIEISPGGQLLFYDLDGSLRTPPSFQRVTSHERERKGPKIRSQVAFEGTRATLAGLDELAEYQQVIVIDTNESNIPWKDRVAFSCAVRLRFISKPEGVEVTTLEESCRLYEFRGYTGNAERLAILTLLHDLARAGLDQPGCVVNDSDLGAHGRINSRLEQLYGGLPLHPSFSLQYAGDAGQEGLNRIVRFCDSMCRSLRRDVAAGEIAPEEYRKHPIVPGVRFRAGVRPGLHILHPLINRVPLVPGTTIHWRFS